MRAMAVAEPVDVGAKLTNPDLVAMHQISPSYVERHVE